MYTLFLCGDVMTGRAIDQVLPFPSEPSLYERSVKDARRYVDLAEKMNGFIPKPVDFGYIWGDALSILDQVNPDARIINLETSITTSCAYWIGKGVHYRMNPNNVPCLTAAKVDCCALANNHVMDWDYKGLAETLRVLKGGNIHFTGAGENLLQAVMPTVTELTMGKIIVFSIGFEDSGIPKSWGASLYKPGVNLIDFSPRSIRILKNQVKKFKQPGDVVVVSVHWGSNWGYEVSGRHKLFAHELLDHAGVDVVHGHSSHHVKGIELYKNKLILYGCGDFITDYEGIPGLSEFRDDLGLMYFPKLDPESGCLRELKMFPTRLKNFRINKASQEETMLLKEILNEHSNIRVTNADGALEWRC